MPGLITHLMLEPPAPSPKVRKAVVLAATCSSCWLRHRSQAQPPLSPTLDGKWTPGLTVTDESQDRPLPGLPVDAHRARLREAASRPQAHPPLRGQAPRQRLPGALPPLSQAAHVETLPRMIDMLIPVLGRPHNVEPLVDSIVYNTAGSLPGRLHLLPRRRRADRRLPAECARHLVVDWEPGRADYARKINWAYERTHSEWIFQGADDIRFSPAWDTKALRYGKYAVIGTNDLHNPSVKRGIHSTHILFKREYIEKYGGTFDGSGKVFSEEYDHQWIDNEFIQTAQRRGQWHFAKNSVVEHYHPVWGNNDWDPTYEKAFRESAEDQALFGRRMRLMERAVSSVIYCARMNLLRAGLGLSRQTRTRCTRHAREAREVIGLQQEQMKRQELEYTKAMLNIALGWRISQEMPEIDHRDELDAAIQDLCTIRWRGSRRHVTLLRRLSILISTYGEDPTGSRWRETERCPPPRRRPRTRCCSGTIPRARSPRSGTGLRRGQAESGSASSMPTTSWTGVTPGPCSGLMSGGVELTAFRLCSHPLSHTSARAAGRPPASSRETFATTTTSWWGRSFTETSS